VIVFGVVGPPEPGAEAEVCELDVAVGVDEDVVRLDVAMDEPHRVNTVDSTGQLGNVKSVEKN
jgi:hypothetical protein